MILSSNMTSSWRFSFDVALMLRYDVVVIQFLVGTKVNVTKTYLREEGSSRGGTGFWPFTDLQVQKNRQSSGITHDTIL